MPKLFQKKLILLLILIVAMTLAAGRLFPASANDLLFIEGFESTPSEIGEMVCAGSSKPNCPTEIHEDSVPFDARAGNYMMKSLVNSNTDPCYRGESVISSTTLVDQYHFNIGSEYWLGFSIYISSHQTVDLGVVWQWKGQPDKDLGEKARNPFQALRLYDGNWKYTMNWDSKENTFESGKRVYGGSKNWTLGSAKLDEWTDWVFHIRLAYDDDSGGFLKIYQDGRKVIDHDGPNSYNDAKGPYMKMGVYNHTACDYSNDRFAYHDEIRVGGADASYEDVAPGGSLPPTSPTPISPSHCSPLGDIDCSGEVNGIDFGHLMANWETSDPEANLDDLGVVNALDALILLRNYGRL